MDAPDCLGPDGTCRCVASDLLDLLGTTYAMDVLCVIASHESARYSTVEDHLPDASTSTLSARLDELEAAGLIDREQFEEVPPRVEYRLSEEGTDLAERLRPLYEWVADRDGAAGEGAGRRHDDGGRRTRSGGRRSSPGNDGPDR